MIQFNTIIKKFKEQGEKTGWTYIEVSENQAQQLFPNNKKSFRVKGKLDDYTFSAIALMPMGDGNFIMPLNLTVRKAIKKRQGENLFVQIEIDKKGYELNKEFLQCLEDDPTALAYFKTLAGSHQKYFSKWIESAKTIETKTKRIVQTINALSKQWDYGTMIRTQTEENKQIKKM
jgi:hypothetical protein